MEKERKPRRRKRTLALLLAATGGTCLVAAFFLPQLVTLAAHSYLTSHGAQLTGCGIERKSSAVFRIPDCTLQSSISTSELRLQLHELTLSFDTLRALLRLGPNIAIDTLNLRVSNRGASSEKESGGGSMPFFSALSIQNGEITLERPAQPPLHLTFTGTAKRADAEKAEFTLHSHSLTASPYVDNLAFDFSGQIALKDSSEELFGKATMKTINLGVLLSEVQFDLTLNRPRHGATEIVIKNATGKAFGGTLSAKELKFGSGQPTEFLLDASEVDLQQLLTFAGNSVEANGKISATIPFIFAGGRLEIHDGALHSGASGGDLHYLASPDMKERAADNSQLAFALAALEAFHYDSINAEFHYDADGTLHAAVALVGENPQIANGRKINLNLNVEENIPSLLKSIRLATGNGEEFLRVQPGEK